MMISGIVVVAGSIGVVMAAGSVVVAGFKYFHEFDPNFSSGSKRSSRDSGYGSSSDSYRQRMNDMKRPSGTNLNR
ncbi:hypothetical protein BH780_gp186 [Bacillus phage Eldridge]|uniref:Uncharacterized protein n=1 Tax=Bacillus phage Eldridge TaxID=1776293 RepID=A0A0Y0ABQ7_9CAUD|nr:hypothetical protein BH780_gp186 [Bacillus phage Eldridge]AMB18769.1 hypothetical protein Eldridge_0189 [Bacillus phage Eldridge]